MPVKKKPTAKQLAARKKFVEMVRARAKAKKIASTHKDTKSHNVNVKVVSGLDSVKRRGRKTQVNYSRIAGVEKVSAPAKKLWTEINKKGYFNFNTEENVLLILYNEAIRKGQYKKAGYYRELYDSVKYY